MADRLAHDDTPSRRRGMLSRLRPVESPSESGFESLARVIRAASPKADLRRIERAFQFAADSHAEQYRASGEPFIEHPLGVAQILAELGMDTVTIEGALLHDVVEDTPLSLDQIEAEFGEEVRLIIDGVTKLDRLQFESREQQQAETLRKMILAMARDIRVILIKLADRLHNMRTIGHLPREKQEAKARETLDVYAPLAHRLGIHQIKWQLEDLSFATLHPKRFDEIVRMVEDRQPERDDLIQTVVASLTDALRTAKLKAEVSGRPKHYWSIYEKMIVRGKEFAEIFDLVGIRVLVESVHDCYAALGVIHSLWKPVPGRFKDYIAMPKFNMYQSLHTAVIGPEGKPLEIQIRSEAMHRTAEYGVAAHWKYKGAGKGTADADMAWLRRMLDWQREMSDPREFMESLRIDLYQDEVFVFTPKGEVLSFPRGATPIDFAYGIHTEVGHKTVGAKVNGRLVPLDGALESGDVVEIVTSKSATAGPHQDWLSIVRTPRARNKIRQWFTRERREDAIEKGRDELTKALRKAGLPVKGTIGGPELAAFAAEMGLAGTEGLLASLGEGQTSPQHVTERLRHEMTDEDAPVSEPLQRPQRMRPAAQHGVSAKGIDDLLVRLARCCTPVPGDAIIGFITRGRGVSVHRVDCPNGKSLAAESERMLEIAWDSANTAAFPVTLQVEALDRTKLLRDITIAISDLGVNITATSSNTNPRTRTAVLRFTIELGDPAHLDHILASVKRIDGVFDAYRVVPGRSRAQHS